MLAKLPWDPALDPDALARATRHLGLGGGDSQVWSAAIRVSSGEPTQAAASALD